MKDATQGWLDRAEEHLEVASTLLGTDHYAQSIFFCQQALEMLLKSMWIEQASEGVPRRTHDLVSLAEELDALGLSEDRFAFLRRLSEQYIPTRYADMPVEYPREVAVEYLATTKEVFAWLRQRLS